MQTSNQSPATLRIGKVSQFDPQTMRARVFFSDLNIISYWLPVLITNSARTKDEYFLDQGEHVACLIQGDGTESGFVLGSIFDDKNSPTVCDKDKRSVSFDDGTVILYDRKAHELSISGPDTITVKGKNLTLKTSGVSLDVDNFTVNAKKTIYFRAKNIDSKEEA